MNILHREQEKDGVYPRMRKEEILQVLFHTQLRIHGAVTFVIHMGAKDMRLPMKYFLDSVKLDLTMVL